MRRIRFAAAALAAAIAGCAPAPQRVPGTPPPLTADAGTATGTPQTTPSRPPPVLAPTGAAALPRSFAPYTRSAFGVTIRLPVPADWSMDESPYGADFGDPSGRLLLRIEIRELAGTAVGATAAQAWELIEPAVSSRLANYRRLDIVDVPGIGDSAADWTFTFDRGVRRQVIDRGISVGTVSVAVYFSAEQTLYGSMLPVFTKVVDGLVIT